ncbi:MAG: hypothetical protein J6T24_04740 [Clostridia bacterium]|nr:hypothetical protein [Clostridia bacterium]
MTVAELTRATARLGFSPSIGDGDLLLRDAARRALSEVAAAHPRTATVTLWHLPSPPLYAESSTEPCEGERILSFPAGHSFFLRVAGRGRLTLTRGEQSEDHTFCTEEGGMPALLGGPFPEGEGEVTLHIRAEGVYRILGLAVYSARFPTCPPDPWAPRPYDLAALFPAFHSLVGPPTTEDGRPLTEGVDGDYTLEEGHLLLLSPHTAGRLRLTYRKRLTLPTEGELPLSEEEASLLPLFCAAYVFLDDDPEKAAFYLARFHEGLHRTSAPEALCRYRDTTGWG